MPANVIECPVEVYVDTLGIALPEPRRTTAYVAWCNECTLEGSSVNWYGRIWPVGYVSAPAFEALLQADEHNDERHAAANHDVTVLVIPTEEPLARPIDLEALATLAIKARTAAELQRSAAVKELEAILGVELRVNEHGAVELTDAQIDALTSSIPTVAGPPSATSQFAGIPIWRSDQPNESE